MRKTVGPGTATLLAALGAGAALGAAFSAASGQSGGQPMPGLYAVSAAALTLIPIFSLRRIREALVLSALGSGGLILWITGSAWVAPGPALEWFSEVTPWVVGALAGLATRLGSRALLRATPLHAGVVAAAFLATAGAPMGAGVAAAVILGAVAAAVEPQLADLGARRLQVRTLRGGGAAAVFLGFSTCWALLRPAVFPTPLAFVAGASAFLVGFTLPAGRGFAALAALGGAAVAWQALQSGVPGALVFVELGLVAGILVRASRPGVLGLVAPALAAALTLPAVRSLPAAWQALGARSSAGLPADAQLRDRITALRVGAPAATTWTNSGATQVWGDSGVALVELDGSVAGSSGRARATERMAGTLAACAAGGRGEARVIGDDFGRVAVSLREQGFERVDEAVADAALAERIAGADDSVRRAWLSADVRLLRVPGPLLIGAAGEVDTIVDIERVGWRDGRTVWPDRRGLARSAARVKPDGAYVLALPGMGVDADALEGAVRAFGDQWPVVAAFVPPQGAEAIVLVGSLRPIPWAGMEACYGKATWLRKEGVSSAVELASLALADHHFARGLRALPAPGWGLPGSTAGALPVVNLLLPATEADHAFGEDAPGVVAERQATRRSALSVLLASSRGDVKGALAQARALEGQPGAGGAIDPMIAPLLERARASAREARAEGAESKKWTEAESAIEAALLMNPASAAARCLRGDIALARRRADAALAAYQDCAEHDAESALAWEGVGRAQQLLGDADAAEVALRTASRLAPGSWTTTLNLGVFLRERGKRGEAEELLRRAEDAASATQDAGRSRPHLALAMLYLETTRAELALAQARRAEIDEPTPDSAYFTGAAQYELKAYPEAEAAYRLALQRRPTMVAALNGLGLCLARKGDYAGAASTFRSALSLDPENQLAREKLELLRPLLGDGGVAPSSAPSPPR